MSRRRRHLAALVAGGLAIIGDGSGAGAARATATAGGAAPAQAVGNPAGSRASAGEASERPAAKLRAMPPPTLRRTDAGDLHLALPAELLTDHELVAQLESGLTTSLVVRVEARDPLRRQVVGVAHLDVRFELWDEEFLLRGFGADGRQLGPAARRVAGRAELARLLPTLELTVLAGAGLDPRAPWTLEIALELVPFSLAEQRDAQRWFSDTVASQRGSATEVGGEGGNSGSGLGRLVDLVMATSLDRRAVRRFAWTSTVAAPRG